MVQHFSNCLLTAHRSTLPCSHASLSTKTVYMEKCVWVTGSIYITCQCAAALCRFAAVIRASVRPKRGHSHTTTSKKHIFCHLYIKAVFYQNPFIFKPIPCGTAATVFEVTIFAADLSDTWLNFLAVCVTEIQKEQKLGYQLVRAASSSRFLVWSQLKWSWLVMESNCNFKSDWKRFVLEVGRLDKQSFRSKI